ncbi:steroid 17-alpha-hydroxylase/17,20 lyase-like [Haliotis rufescens]|uniref:steroid 17-alpha-hydroxylase/17,20 lyase-like n=1 Tax=Haliotis rufescens TaxID=6454 RepID=UPI00201EB210|nr:steroid 17-alpha-hydroxylase/17,20 lyase-like [Haliotis rufescens]
MDMALTYLLSLIVGLLVWLLYQKWSSYRKRPLPPGPSGVRVFSEIISALQSQRVHLSAVKWAKEHGDMFSVNAIGKTMVFLNTSELVREVMNGADFKAVTNDRPETFFGKYVANNYSNITEFVTYDSTLVYFRKMFHNSLKLYGDGVHSFEALALEELQNVAHILSTSSGNVDMETVFSESLLRVIHILITGDSAHRETNIIDDMKNYNLWGNRLNGFDVQTVLATIPVLRHFPIKHGRIWQNAVKYRDAVAQVFVKDRKKRNTLGEDRGGVVSVLLEEQRRKEEQQQQQQAGARGLTDDQISAITLDMSAAAYLTSKGALVGMFLSFLHYPHIQERIYNEIEAKIGTRNPVIEDRSSLPYTEATILELLRYISHAVLGVPHSCRKDIEVRGFTIPKNAMVVSNLWYIHHDEAVWGDPWKFRPERFLRDDGTLLGGEHPLRRNLLPFGTGRRQCPGETLARSRLFLYVTFLLQRFVFLPPEGETLPPFDPSLWNPGIIIQPLKFTCRVSCRLQK